MVAHRVIGIRADTSPAGTRQLTEFVGRGRELAELREALEHARHSRGQLVSIVGECRFDGSCASGTVPCASGSLGFHCFAPPGLSVCSHS